MPISTEFDLNLKNVGVDFIPCSQINLLAEKQYFEHSINYSSQLKVSLHCTKRKQLSFPAWLDFRVFPPCFYCHRERERERVSTNPIPLMSESRRGDLSGCKWMRPLRCQSVTGVPNEQEEGKNTEPLLQEERQRERHKAEEPVEHGEGTDVRQLKDRRFGGELWTDQYAPIPNHMHMLDMDGHSTGNACSWLSN